MNNFSEEDLELLQRVELEIGIMESMPDAVVSLPYVGVLAIITQVQIALALCHPDNNRWATKQAELLAKALQQALFDQDSAIYESIEKKWKSLDRIRAQGTNNLEPKQ
ncbi:hypothetical protein [Microseira wollei]|uniref:Uncharacterized protein n=1 Tax=Microseira wollei NIES-4236 TaxID=2530354 RepID=A0AAV3XPW9_9CYAN|nr:hypothetical protein [Microseira wollei]GET44614.1 hypothetical protein MiSe_94450 [Microseira wollei NIES-4236]